MTDKITIDRALLEQALEFIKATNESSSFWRVPGSKLNKTVAALRSALSEKALQRLTDIHQEMEQPQQERPYLSPKLRAVLEQSQQVAWRDHVEQRLLTWRQSFVNKSGDQLALDDFMDKRSLNDLIDFVCSEYTSPPAPRRLTDEAIVDLWTDIALQNNGSGWHAIGKQFARAIEDRILGGKT